MHVHACMVLYIRSRQKASHIMIPNIINGKSEENRMLSGTSSIIVGFPPDPGTVLGTWQLVLW